MFSNLKIKLKGLHFADVPEIQEVVNDELKKAQKEEFSAAFQKLYEKAYICHWNIMNKKNMLRPRVYSIFKKSQS
jgi:HD superfamily phosphohydrolase YqeK